MVTAIVGANWGDEGKGKITDMLAETSDIIIRFQGGANAGHTIINNYGKFALHTLPSGVFYDHTVSIIGNGVALDIPKLFKEIKDIESKGVPTPKILVSDRAQMVMPYHILLDGYEEERLAGKSFGSTKSGIAPFYSDKYAKIGFQVSELFDDEESLKDKISRVITQKNVLLEHLYHKPLLTVDEVYATLMEFKAMVEPYVCDVSAFLYDAIKAGKNILLEGQLGSMKDPDHGIYPMVTSSSTLAGYGAVGAGVPPYEIRRIVTVSKAYSSAVGAGAFVSEIFGEEARAGLEVSQEASAGAARPVKIAAAHHADDQAETVLMNLARGSGPSGLSGMRPVREDERGFTLIRPLLSASRAEIEAYVRARGCGWCEDSTNASGENTRSRLRQDVMPQLETTLPGAARHMAAFAEKEREQEDFLDSLAKQSLAEVQSEGGSLKLPALSSLHSVLRQRVLALWLEQNGGRKDVTQAHYDALEELIFGQSGRRLDLPGGRCVLRDQISLRMSRIDHPSSLRRENFREDFSTRVFPAGKNVQFPKKIYTKWLDYDTISEPLCFRSRKEGDYLMLPDGGRQSLQDFLVNEKIPLGERDSIPLAASGSHVLWVVGHRISAAAKITDKTKTIIEIIYGGEYGEASSGRTDRQ